MRGILIAAAVLVMCAAPAASAAGPQDRSGQVERLEDAIASLEEAIAKTDASIEELHGSLDRVTSQRDEALRQRDALEATIARARSDASDWRLTTYLLAGIGLVGVCVVLVRRRRTVTIKIPDTADDLLGMSDRTDRSR